MKSVVQRVLGEFITAGRLGKTELDEAAQGVLEKMEAKVRAGRENRTTKRSNEKSRFLSFSARACAMRHPQPTLQTDAHGWGVRREESPGTHKRIDPRGRAGSA